VKDFKKARNNDTGLLCFSTNWTNPLLWSHYAAKHTGVCLGFDLKKGITRPVRYEEKRLMARVEKKTDRFVMDEDLKEQLFLTKSHHWQYEDERRIVIDLSKETREGKFYFHRFDKDMVLSEVILGPRCSLKLDKVRNVTRTTNPCAIVFRSRLEFGEFRVIRNGRDLPSFGLLYEANSVSASKLTLACLRHHDLRCQGLASEPLSKLRLDHVKGRFSIGSLVVVGQGFFRCCM